MCLRQFSPHSLSSIPSPAILSSAIHNKERWYLSDNFLIAILYDPPKWSKKGNEKVAGKMPSFFVYRDGQKPKDEQMVMGGERMVIKSMVWVIGGGGGGRGIGLWTHKTVSIWDGDCKSPVHSDDHFHFQTKAFITYASPYSPLYRMLYSTLQLPLPPL